jgi:hypothetical protein
MERTHCIHTSHNEIHKIPICRGFGSRDSEYYGNWNSVQKYLAKNTRKHAVCNTQKYGTVQIQGQLFCYQKHESTDSVYCLRLTTTKIPLTLPNIWWRNASIHHDKNDKKIRKIIVFHRCCSVEKYKSTPKLAIVGQNSMTYDDKIIKYNTKIYQFSKYWTICIIHLVRAQGNHNILHGGTS